MDIIYFILGILGIVIIGKILIVPVRIILKLIANGILGGITLLLINLLSQYTGIFIKVTPISSLIVGILGLPGIILLSLFYNF